MVDQERSNEVAFEVAANDAVLKAMKNNIVLLEPIMKLEVTVPEEFLGNVDLRPVRETGNNRTLGIQRQVLGGRGPRPPREDVRLRRQSPQSDPGPGWLDAGAASIRPAPPDVLKSFTNPDY